MGICTCIRFIKPNHQSVRQHALSVYRKRKEITKTHLLVVGKSIKCQHAAVINDEIKTLVVNWIKFAKELGVSLKLRNVIYTTIKDWN